MKKIGFILLALVFSVNLASAQEGKKAPKAEFGNIEHNFGKIQESDKVAVTEFKFKNTGNAPLIIQRVVTTCGCTSPEYTRKPINPGETGSIKVSYDAEGRPGVFNKKITVFSNVPNEVYALTIKGEVIRKR